MDKDAQDEEKAESLCDLNWLSSVSDTSEEDIFQR